MLFTVGMFIAIVPPAITFPGMSQPMVLLVSCLVLMTAAVLGNVAGYFVGKWIGPAIFKPREGFWGRVFDPKRVDQTHELMERYGPRALVLARFVPFARTFITLIAGIGRMNLRRDLALDWDGKPALLIETVEVTIQRFRDVPEDFALAEGEGDFEEWKRGHIAYFTRNGGYDPDMLLVCERFRLIEVLA